MHIRGIAQALILGAVMMISAGAGAQTDVVATLFSKPVTLADISPTAEQLSQLARMNSASKDMALAQYRHTRLSETILEAVLEDFASQKGIVTDEELKRQFTEKFADQYKVPQGEEGDETSSKPSLDDVAEKQVRRWQIDKALYEQYGGTVIFRQSNPQLPVGAYVTLLREYQQAGKFSIPDERYSAVFWKAFEPPYTFELEPEQVDFSAPWWL